MIGLLLDCLSQNTGDQAILQVMIEFLRGHNQDFEVVSPHGFRAERYEPMIVGGGHIIRDRGDWFYDAFRVPGRHILNVAGVSACDDLNYLAEYSYVSVRSRGDCSRVVAAAPATVISPCVSLMLAPDDPITTAADGAIGFHFHERSWAACGDESLFLRFKDYRQCLIPITHYNGDYWLLKKLSDRISVEHALLPRLKPSALLGQIGRLRALVCSSLHAAIFAYSRNVPFIAFGQPERIVEFMEDRGLQDWVFRDRQELFGKLAALLDSPPDYSASLRHDLKTLDEHFRHLSDRLPRAFAPGIQNPVAAVATLPSAEHGLFAEHHNRIAVLERMAERLLARSERLESDASRPEHRLNHLRQVVEPGVLAGATPPLGTLGPPLPGLPFGSVQMVRSLDPLSDRVLELEELRERIDAKLRDLAQQNQDLGARFADGMAALDTLEAIRSDVGHCREASESSQDKIRAHETDLGALTAHVMTLRRDIDDLARESVSLGRRVSVCESAGSAMSARVDGISTELTLLSGGVSSVSEDLLSLANTVEHLRVASAELGRENSRAIRAAAAVLAHLQRRVQSNTERLRALYQSRIWKTLQALAAPLNAILRSERTGGAIPSDAGDPSDAEVTDSLAAMLGSAGPAEPALKEDEPSSNSTASARPNASQVRADPENTPGPESALRIGIDCRIPGTITVAKGNAICLHGWCYHAQQRISRLEVVAGTVCQLVNIYGTVRSDVFSKHYPHLDSFGYSFRSGFWAIVVLPERLRTESVDFYLRAKLETGELCLSKIGTTTLSPGFVSPPARSTQGALDRPLVVVCMATCNPPIALFRRQIESLARQSYANWICVISDDCSRPEIYAEICATTAHDTRFSVFQASERLGFYRNFEHCLSLVPDGAEFVALCDHDDFWYPDKLESLLAAFDSSTSLAYSDMRIVDAEGKVIAGSYWTTRVNNYKNLTSLLIANTVTGAASMFRRDLLGVVLPFPEVPGEPFHDHWIACIALATGKIAYVDRPLYDYVQHSRNVIGHYAPRSGVSWLRNAWIALRNRAALDYTMALWRNIYFGDVLRIEIIARIIELRGGNLLSRRKKRILHRLSRMDDAVLTGFWLLLRRVRELWCGNETLAAETRLLRGVLWRYCAVLRSRLGPGPRTTGVPRGIPAQIAQMQPPGILDAVEVIRQKIAPLKLAVAPDAIRRVNLLIPTIDFDYVFGGYIAKFCLAQKLADMGFRVRIVIVDYCDFRPAFWKQQLRSFEGIGSVLDSCELTYAFDRTTAIAVSANDAFVATTWWTAQIAHQATKELGKREFLYLIQEYEPFTFPMGTFASLACETYGLPHRPIFSTEFLREYFRQQRLGVFANAGGEDESRSAVFENAITDIGHVTLDDLQSRRTRRLLFYARPEAHAARNMFELGMLALCRAIDTGVFDSRWEFVGIGSVGPSTRVRLSRGREIEMLRRQSQADYKKVLMAHDVGLSLMYTPHPSLVPIEMASAGMIVVTNTFGNKTEESLHRISPNIMAVPPTIESIVAALRVVVSQVEHFEKRVAGAHVNWPRNWTEALNEALLARIAGFLKEISA